MNEQAEQILDIITKADGVLVGQDINDCYSAIEPPFNYDHNVEELYRLTGKYPAIIGASFNGKDSSLWPGCEKYKHAPLIALLIDYWKAGGFVQVDIPMFNPWTGGPYDDRTRTRLADLLTPDLAVHDVYVSQINFIHSQLALLRDAGVVVLFRPFHEMTHIQAGWWGAVEWWYDNGARRPQMIVDFVTLWRDLYARFSDLDNLIWVYGAANTDEGYVPCDAFWPGDDIVHIAGFSLYSVPPSEAGLARLASHGKPLAFTEFGGPFYTLDNRLAMLKAHPQIKYVLHWSSWPDSGAYSIVDSAHASEYMNDPYIIAHDRIAVPAPTATVTASVSRYWLFWWRIKIAWSTENAGSAKINGNAAALSGTRALTVSRRGTYTYTLTATAADGHTATAIARAVVK